MVATCPFSLAFNIGHTSQLCMLDYKLPGCKSADTTLCLSSYWPTEGLVTLATGSLTGLKILVLTVQRCSSQCDSFRRA